MRALCFFPLALALSTGAAAATDAASLLARGYQPLACLFDQRCLIGQPCEAAYRDMHWIFSDDTQRAYRVRRDGTLRGRGQVMKDSRWKDTSQARAILNPMREAVASHLTVFDGGGAIMSLQYAADPGSGQFLLGTCEIGKNGE